jgi:hypothetical protein
MAKKSWDLYLAWRQCKKITRRHNVCGLLTFGNVAAAFGALLKPVFAAKLIIYGYEPHALFMVDMGAWKKGGLKSKALTRYERMAEKKSDFLLTGTSHYKKVLEDKGLQNVYRAPSSVDGNIFLFNHHSRSQIRNEFHLKGRKVLVYAGKFGGLYYHEGTAQFCAGLLKQDPSFFFLILTPHAKEEIASLFNDAGILDRDVHILKANNPEEVAHYFSAGDIGLNTIPPLPSQRYRSPIKVGEYLMCGLPFITCPGISEDDTYAVEHEVGLVVPELSFETGVATASRISDLLKEEKESLRNRCRNTGLIYRGDHIVNEIFSEIFDEI